MDNHNPWRNKVLAYNVRRKEREEKAADLDKIVATLFKQLTGQLLALLPDEVVAVLKKHGYKD